MARKPPSAARQLPSAAPPPPISLDTLIARHAAPTRRPDRGASVPPSTADALARSARLFPGGPFATGVGSRVAPLPSAPGALVLPVTVATCATCGSVTRSPPHYVLGKFAPNAFTFHYSKLALAALPPSIPREVQEHATTVPFCEACFGA